MMTGRPVIIQQLPQRLVRGQLQAFFKQVEPFLDNDRPRIVLDFSHVEQMDSAGVEMLLTCMEEAMKRNGDVKLAALRPGPAVILELTGVDRLFEIFENTADAVESFHRFPSHAFSQSSTSWHGGITSQSQRAL